jgi:hypothetical protein
MPNLHNRYKSAHLFLRRRLKCESLRRTTDAGCQVMAKAKNVLYTWAKNIDRKKKKEGLQLITIIWNDLINICVQTTWIISVMTKYSTAELTKFVSLIRNDRQYWARFCEGLTQDWHFAIENEWGLTFFSTRTTKPICNFENPGTVQTTESANISRYVILNFCGPFGRDGSWTYNNQCNQCLSPLTMWVQILSDEVYSIQHYVIKFVSDLGRSVVFSGYSDFLHQYNWPPRYNWNIVESGIKHHNP